MILKISAPRGPYILKTDTAGWILCELKTDSSSYEPKQLEVYCRVANDPAKASALIKGVEDVRPKSRAKQKYGALLKATSKHTWTGPIDVLYLAPDLPSKAERELFPTVLWLKLREVFDEWTPKDPDILFYRLRKLLAPCSKEAAARG